MRQTDCLPVTTNGCKIYDQGKDSKSPVQITNGSEHTVESPVWPPMPAGLEPLKHQLAGHKFCDKNNKDLYGILDCKDGTILKPVILNTKRGQREKYFYELVNGVPSVNPYFPLDFYQLELLRKLKKFTPIFRGFISLLEHPNVIYIKMVDMCSGFTKPHTIDVKIGAKAWGPTASVEKIKRQKCRCPHLDTICFQVLGAKYYDAQSGDAVVKLDLRKYNPHNLLHTGLYEIFNRLPAGAREAILQFILDDLKEIADWFIAQSHLSFRGSSVLIVFEADEKALGVCLGENNNRSASILQVKMIDFVHVWETTSVDSNYLEGINSLISYITSLADLFRSFP